MVILNSNQYVITLDGIIHLSQDGNVTVQVNGYLELAKIGSMQMRI